IREQEGIERGSDQPSRASLLSRQVSPAATPSVESEAALAGDQEPDPAVSPKTQAILEKVKAEAEMAAEAKHRAHVAKIEAPAFCEDRSSLSGFRPDEDFGVPNVAPDVDIEDLLLRRRKYRLRSEGDPTEKLDGTDRRAYRPWKRAVTHKITHNLPALMFHKDQVDYALSQLSGNLLHAMAHWESASPSSVSFPAFIEELERVLGIAYLQRDALRALETIQQESFETVSQFYARIIPLLRDSGKDSQAQVECFIEALLPRYRGALLVSHFDTVEAARDEAALAEWRSGSNRTRSHTAHTSGSRRTGGTPRTGIDHDTTSADLTVTLGPLPTEAERTANAKLMPALERPAAL
ncbi:hypothetical protein KEM52_003024, partial [Ascosphaera acerosa]